MEQKRIQGEGTNRKRPDREAAQNSLDRETRKPAPEVSGFWGKFGIAAPVLSSLVIAGFGFLAALLITSALERERLELDHLGAMRELMTILGRPGIDPSEAEAAAVSLAAYGDYAVIPLIHQLQAEGQTRPSAAMHGLRAVALEDPAKPCEILTKILKNRTRLYHWKTHGRVIRLLGEIGCTKGRDDLESLKVLIENSMASPEFEPYSLIVQDKEPKVKKKVLKNLQRSLEEALQNLE